MIKEHERVVLRTALLAEGLEAGDVGAVVRVGRDGLGYGVDPATPVGSTVAQNGNRG